MRGSLSLAVLLCAGAAALAADPPAYTDPPVTPKEREHWSFRPPARAALPSVHERNRVRTPVDRFVLARLEAAGLTYGPDADRRTLIRRLSFDLTGLPPTPAEVDAFLADQSPDAYEKLVDRLLASPHYGERWGQHWLDVVRFAESNGFELDAERPQAWRYRDYVVASLNADKPYDRFLTEQIAGDLLAKGKDPRQAADLLHATGLHRCGPVHVVSGNLEKEQVRQEVLTEMVTGVGSAVLGLTVGCARCHDHKFDPLSLGDYYRLQAFFAGTKFKDVDLATDAEKAAAKVKREAIEAQIKPIQKAIDRLEAPARVKAREAKKAALDPEMRAAVDTEPKNRTAAQKKLAKDAEPVIRPLWDEVIDAMAPAERAKRAALKAEQVRLEETLPPPTPQAWAVGEEEKRPPTFVLRRGDLRRRAGEVPVAFPRVIATEAKPGDRLDLAKWLTRPAHPLTARVIVNRLWQHHFGRGLVATPNDFGTKGERPTHPDLLDWLARELVEPTWQADGATPWALKRMHRLLVLSTAYRQRSRTEPTAAAMKADPDNRLLWRQNRHRLEAEAIRDAVLATAGTLTRTVGGPSVKVPLEPEVYDLIFTEGEPVGLWPVTPDPAEHTRRSLYLLLKRNVRLPVLEAFDQPDTLSSCAARSVSTFAPQALILMNGPFTREQSRRLAAELERTAGSDPAKQVTALFRRALGRAPTAEELAAATGFLRQQAGPDAKTEQALADLCLAVFNLNEFVYVE
ncbi:MAG: DUF1553 domain-containing protein [Gemmataceae bacterium]